MFEQVATTLASGLNELGAYYNENHLRPNPAKTQLTAFHLKNHQADRKLNVTWNGMKLTGYMFDVNHIKPVNRLIVPSGGIAVATCLHLINNTAEADFHRLELEV